MLGCPAGHLQGIPAYRCTSALGTVLHNQQISEFNKGKQVYMKEELSPLPFQPPAFYEYTNAMIIGTAKVGRLFAACCQLETARFM